MYKTDLLEKNQQNLFKILEILYLDGNPVTKQSLTKKLKISPATLKRYLEDLNEDVQPLVDENKVEIKIEANTASFKNTQKLCT
ncbi:HTH domain-containing protein [Pediococcus parvulus]|uniref:HTH domain-containing protein n=1 Tax=Pediococcus parvulus TaxID=54062 RepID=A0AAP5TBA8_9LACO|nr:HTH domain-containing protein [Pediococcus parvulus]